jgi:hypothetical protein
MPSKMLSPPLTVTLLFSVGCEAPETTRADPPLAGVLKAKVSLPMVRAYQVFLLQELAE